MCHSSCIRFGIDTLKRQDIEGRRVLEVGSRDLNGSLRPYLTTLDPARYLGIDMEPGKGVDEICDAGELVRRYGEFSWDVIVCTEVLEHVWDWQLVISNLKRGLVEDGRLLLTTRSPGFAYHPHPVDFWRFELIDMCRIFADFKLLVLQGDPEVPGVFVYVSKPPNFVEQQLEGYPMYSMLTNRRLDNRSKAPIEVFIRQTQAQIERLSVLERDHRRLLERG